ncbi:unnamed protein product [Rotaria sp. Silwood1]|nr:unnamed protein product [Rotaria sp. Silwood1]CAF0866394.1 unnamed protein product [Rotaria sp. Silwood1]CAF3357360.1 unnamed protein product [Rotaria sp. Silwood1]CAF3380789.1 unnamed protein product [Rotaria sp. Silwood1]CAF3388805.1 unnamed protein product [Rotaria sp. Silwood1]
MISSSEIFVFLHGFTKDGGSIGGGGQIAKYVASLFHIPIEQPNLNQPSFNEFSVSNAIKVIDKLYDEKQKQNNIKDEKIKMNLIGASGYIAARYAELHPDRIKKLFLLCPAFGLAARWREFLSHDDLSNWKSSGSYSYNGHQLHYVFFDDITQNHPLYPQVLCPTSIVHGKLDRLVPIEASRDFINEQKNKQLIKLVEVDDDHYLTNSLFQIIPIVSQFLLSSTNN